MFQTSIEVFYGSDDYLSDGVCDNVVNIKPEKSKIILRDYQGAAYQACINDLDVNRSSLLVLATGLGKTILFSKIIESWVGKVLVLVEREELLQNAYSEISSITGEIIGVERQKDHYDGERVCVATVQSLSLRIERFRPNHFSLIIIDEAHHAASDIYIRLLDHFGSAKVIGLTATDSRADKKKLPFSKCSYRMEIGEGIDSGYLVPIRGRRVIIDSIDLTRVKKKGDGDFDETALDDEMVKGAAAIADVIYNDHAFDKGILFFPGCASAKLTSEFLNKKSEGLSVYIDGKITGDTRRNLVGSLRRGESNWLCNVGIATEGFNWPEASVIGMCAPTLSRSAYVQRAGRGTRTLEGILNGVLECSERVKIIAESAKPYMTILDFVGVSTNLNLVSHESLLSDTKESEIVERVKREKEESEDEQWDEIVDQQRDIFGRSGIASSVQSKTLHSIEEFDPINEGSFSQGSLELKSNLVPEDPTVISEKQSKLLMKFGLDCSGMTKKNAQKLVGFVAQKGFRLTTGERLGLHKLYESIMTETVNE